MPSDPRRPLYPPSQPFRTGRLPVSDLHEIHLWECGNPDGIPALVLHGGTGGGIMPFLRQGRDPARYRIILFDQRGCGQSIHGRYDMITPMSSAHGLAQTCPDVRLVVVPDAGQTGPEPGIADAMARATDALADRFAALSAPRG